jgi:putative hydrolase of the HAD superfamily
VSRVWLFDLDDTLHDAGSFVFGDLRQAMALYMQRELALTPEQADVLRQNYLRRYGATLLGLVRHHGVKAAHFLHDTHRLPGLEQRVCGHRHDFAALARLGGRKFIVTNAPRAYAERVLRTLRIAHLFDGLIAIEDMSMFGQLRPKPDARMLRALLARLQVPAARCVLIEDTLRHHKAARKLGICTVWMRRFARRGQAAAAGPRRWLMRPGYVDAAVRNLRAVERRFGRV